MLFPRTCYRDDGLPKLSFSTRKMAKEAQRKGLVIYECPNCAQFHLASKHK